MNDTAGTGLCVSFRKLAWVSLRRPLRQNAILAPFAEKVLTHSLYGTLMDGCDLERGALSLWSAQVSSAACLER